MFSIKSIKNVFSFNSYRSSGRTKKATAVSASPSVARPKASTPWAPAQSASRIQTSLPKVVTAPQPKAERSPFAAAHKRLLRSVTTLGTWGANIELVALARSQGVTIHVVGKDPSAKNTGDVHAGRVQAVINEGGGRAVYVAYDGLHYDALLRPSVSDDGEVRAYLASSPGDGDCMFHSVATTTIGSASHLPGIISLGLVSMRKNSALWQGVFAGEPSISDDQAGYVMRQAYALQLRYDAANELRKPEYAEGAFLQELSGF